MFPTCYYIVELCTCMHMYVHLISFMNSNLLTYLIDLYVGSIIVQGTYLKKNKVLKNGIHFTNCQPKNKVYQYSNHVTATGLTLHPVKGPRIHKWRLDIDDHEKILNVIQQRVDPLDMI